LINRELGKEKGGVIVIDLKTAFNSIDREVETIRERGVREG